MSLPTAAPRELTSDTYSLSSELSTLILPAPDSRAGNPINLSATNYSNSDPLLPDRTKAYVSGCDSQDAEYLSLNTIKIFKDKLFSPFQVQRFLL